MRDNPPLADPLPFGLPGHGILTMEGQDASTFAHSQFMNDVAALNDGHWQWNGWLTPKGRVIALFALLKFDPQTLWLVLPDAAPSELAVALRRFVFRSKVILTPRTEWGVIGAFDAPRQARQARFDAVTMIDSRHVELDMSAEAEARTLLIRASDASSHDLASAPISASAARWAALDLQHGLPRIAGSQSEQWTPQHLSLDRLHAYSIKKGCYPGQEIVARTHFLGKVKRGLALFRADGIVPAGADVLDAGHAIGTVVSSAAEENGCAVLAVVPLDGDNANLRADDLALTPRPLLGGLER